MKLYSITIEGKFPKALDDLFNDDVWAMFGIDMEIENERSVLTPPNKKRN